MSYKRIYNEYFKGIVEEADGTLNHDKVIRELADYATLLQNVPKVYCHITDGRISKPNTDASVVIAVADDIFNEYLEEGLKNG